jgi:hypothetical protein
MFLLFFSILSLLTYVISGIYRTGTTQPTDHISVSRWIAIPVPKPIPALNEELLNGREKMIGVSHFPKQ